ncbi:M1 family metallopeptidase [Dyella sp. C9]|uniref:M1 family metallopeptidase n=1 Tax=Dyella sp. C9 TaxID=2202154 RepID=UPI001E2940E7|nr:M1 family metallopeptidase [Dyella sp. C9]
MGKSMGGWRSLGLAWVCCLAWCGAAHAQQAPAPASSVEPAPIVEIPLTGARAAAPRVASNADAWGGVRQGNEPTLSDRVVGYRIDAELDAAHHSVKGSEQLTWRNRSDRAVDRIYLHLYLNAFQNEGSTFFTERSVLDAHGRGSDSVPGKGEWGWIDLKSVQQGNALLKWEFVHPDDGPGTDETVARVDLAEPVPAGGTLTLDIDFLSQLPRVISRTGWWGHFNLVAQWFPKIGVLELPGERGADQLQWNVHEFHYNSEFYADFGQYDVRLTVPSDYTVGAVGALQGPPEQGNGKSTYHFVQGDVHDFAWVAAKDFKTLESNWQGPGSPRVAVRVIYPAEYVASAQPVLKATLDSLDYFSRTLGPYPYRTVTAVVPPFNAEDAGGMEYPTFFTAEGHANIDPQTMDQWNIDFVTIHEFGHGYFYGILASNEFEEPMLDEGINEYWDERMLRDRNQRVLVPDSWLRRAGITPSADVFVTERATAGLSHPFDPLGQNSWDRYSNGSYGTVYARTATAMHDLEARFGRDVMERAMREYYQRWRFRHPSVADLRAVLIDVSGDARTVNRVFDQYVYGTARIDDRVASIVNQEVLPMAGSWVAHGERSERSADEVDDQVDERRAAWRKDHPGAGVNARGPYPWRGTVTVVREGAAVPQRLRVTFADGSREDVRWDDDRRWARFVFTRPTRVVSAELDPDQQILLDENKLNDSRAVKADPSASRRWTADAATLLQSFYALLGTL